MSWGGEKVIVRVIGGSRVEVYEGRRKVCDATFYDPNLLKKMLDLIRAYGHLLNIRVVYAEG